MTAHNHREITPGCYRCDLGKEEALASQQESIGEAEEALHAAGWFARADLDPDDIKGILWDLSDAGLLL